jgi:hypothetical protein
MPIELQTALISAVVALITALFGGYLTWNQIQHSSPTSQYSPEVNAG